jgi:integrase
VSIHKHKNGYLVKWREDGRQRSKTFRRRDHAQAWERDRVDRAQLGPRLAAKHLDQPDELMTLDQFIVGEWRTHALNHLSHSTRTMYAWALEKHCAELLDQPLIALTAPVLSEHQQLMFGRGASPNTVREVFAHLASVLQLAVQYGHVPGNNARGLRKVRKHIRPEVTPLYPAEFERLLAMLEGRDRAIAVLGGYLGLRPIEIRLARWDQLRDGKFHIAAADTKPTAAYPRSIVLPRFADVELREWQLRSGGRGRAPIVEGEGGGAMTPNALRLWGSKRLRPCAQTVTEGRIAKITTNTLRHSHASALHYAGFTVPEAARRMGHKQATHLLHYAHILEGMGDDRYAGLDALYSAMRDVARDHRVAALGEQ